MTTATGRTGNITLELPEGWVAGPERPEYELLAFAPRSYRIIRPHGRRHH